ncbi:hypothetical protein [Kribbella sp. VKM Ac-2571]|nr:hypothetical protein [Kribbella sp. VKM Ac-2571]
MPATDEIDGDVVEPGQRVVRRSDVPMAPFEGEQEGLTEKILGL